MNARMNISPLTMFVSLALKDAGIVSTNNKINVQIVLQPIPISPISDSVYKNVVILVIKPKIVHCVILMKNK